MPTVGKSVALVTAFSAGAAIAACASPPLCGTATGPCRPPGPQIAALPSANVAPALTRVTLLEVNAFGPQPPGGPTRSRISMQRTGRDHDTRTKPDACRYGTGFAALGCVRSAGGKTHRSEEEWELPPESSSAADGRPRASRRRRLRWALFLLLPIALIAGTYFYFEGGAYTSTDDAFIEADKVGLSTDVSGMVEAIEVGDNEHVTAGQVLFRLDPLPFQLKLDQAQSQLGVVRDNLNALKANYQNVAAQIKHAEDQIAYNQRQYERDCRKIGGQAAIAIGGDGSLAGWNFCPKPEPSVPL